MKTILLNQLAVVEKLANNGKVNRLLSNPYKYLSSIFYRKFFYPRSKKAKLVKAKTFFNDNINLLIPSGIDIYLTGGKTHQSEINLAKFIIKNLSLNDCFIDVGAHYGYFTLLASKIVGEKGKVHSFEAAPKTYNILIKNKAI